MAVQALSVLRNQIVDRREKLAAAIGAVGPRPELAALMAEVDAALQRLDFGTYGLCETCRDPIEPDRLLADPLARFCLDHLSPSEQRALERDLELAARIQRELLPDASRAPEGWDIAYFYEPARVVSGDYCDLLSGGDASYFMLGDVTGKGIAASMLMSHLHAMMRVLVPTGLPLDALLERASHVFCEITLPTHYATIVCGRASADGVVDVCNAGHVPPLVARRGHTAQLAPGGMPLGMFSSQQFAVEQVRLERGDLIVLCSDGFTEAENGGEQPYGLERLAGVIREFAAGSAAVLVDACVRDLRGWRGARRPDDDVSLMVVRRAV